MGLGLLFTILMCIFAPQIIKVFMDKPDIITNGAMMLRFQQIGMTFMSVSLISTCVCQAVGNAGGAFVLSISRQGVIYVLALLSCQMCLDIQEFWYHRRVQTWLQH